MRNWLIIIGVLVAAAGVLKFTVFNDDGSGYLLETVSATSGPIVMTIETNGTIEPLSTVMVGCSEVAGKIIEMNVGPDDAIKKDQVICRIDPRLAQAEHDQSKAELTRAKSALEEAEVARNAAKADLPQQTKQALAKKQEAEAALVETDFAFKRIDGLKASGDANELEWTVSKSAFLRAQAAVNAASATHDLAVNNETFQAQRTEQAVQQATAALELAKARIDLTTSRVERCTILSPIDGIVLKRFKDVGATVNATFMAEDLFLLAPPLDRMRVVARVSESDIGYVSVGQPAKFTLTGRTRTTFEGKILERRSQPDIVQNVVTYTVIFEVVNDARRTLLPGLTVNAEIECVNKPSVTKIANSALRFKPPLSLEERNAMLDAAKWPPEPMVTDGADLGSRKKDNAWRFDESTRSWHVVPLWIGVADNAETEVLAGAKPGDTLVKRFEPAKKGGFDFKDALRQADPGNRQVL